MEEMRTATLSVHPGQVIKTSGTRFGVHPDLRFTGGLRSAPTSGYRLTTLRVGCSAECQKYGLRLAGDGLALPSFIIYYTLQTVNILSARHLTGRQECRRYQPRPTDY